MNKSINQLEHERIERIKNLNLDEVKAYITNLNKKVYESFDNRNPDDIDFYEDKLKEVFDLTSDKFVNLDVYSLMIKYRIVASQSIENDTKKQITYTSYSFLLLNESYLILHQLYYHLDYILMIYFHNYYTRDTMLVDELLAQLHCEYGFNNEEFNNYAHSRVTKYNKTLMKELDSLIDEIKDTIYHIIELTDSYFNENYNDEVSFVLKQIEYEKEYLNKKGDKESVKLLREGEYLDLLETLKEAYIKYGECCSNYIEIREKILGLIESPDGFREMKEFHYDFSNKNGVVFSSKEEYIASRPSYDVSKCKFIKSG